MASEVVAERVPPLVDLSVFHQRGSNADAQLSAAAALCRACHEHGYTSIKGHGIHEALISESFTWAKKLFDLSHEDKMKAPHPPTAIPHRGYSAPGIEKVYSVSDLETQQGTGNERESLRKIKDYKESYEVGSESNPVQPNIWLPEEVLPGYRDFTTRLYWALDRACKVIHQAFALGLGLTEEGTRAFIGLHSGHNNQLRLLHYPPVESKMLREHVVGRMPAHQDWSLFTLDFQDSTGGLEVQDLGKMGSFVAVPPLEGTCVLNIGDMMQRFSNGYLPSALHRVGLPPEKDDSAVTKARRAIVYFYAPDNEAVVEPLSACITKERPVAYEPVEFAKYGEWLSKHMY